MAWSFTSHLSSTGYDCPSSLHNSAFIFFGGGRSLEAWNTRNFGEKPCGLRGWHTLVEKRGFQSHGKMQITKKTLMHAERKRRTTLV